MKPIRLFLLLGLVAVSISAFSVEASLKISGTMKQIIGTFSTFGHPHVGDTFELDVSELPKNKIQLVRPDSEHASPYIPLPSPLAVDRVQYVNVTPGFHHIRLLANDNTTKLVVQVNAQTLEKGQKITIYFYEEFDGNIGCMAEATGIIK